MTAKKITSWSFSRYSDYRQCPLKAKLKHIDKLKEPPNAAMARGAAIHNLAENYIKGILPKLPPELKHFAAEFKMLRKQYLEPVNGMCVEDNWAFTESWERTQWDNWTMCWVRIKLDCAHHLTDDVLIVTDWKTGKFRASSNDEYMEQLELYALSALLIYPHLREVRPRLGYLDSGEIYPPLDVRGTQELIFTPADVPRLKKLWMKRVKPMLSDTVFAPRPNQFCNWCHFRKGNGGPCKF